MVRSVDCHESRLCLFIGTSQIGALFDKAGEGEVGLHTVRANRKVRFQSEIVNRCGEPSCRASLTIKKMTKSHLDRKSQQKNDLLSGTMDRLLNRVSVRRALRRQKPKTQCVLPQPHVTRPRENYSAASATIRTTSAAAIHSHPLPICHTVHHGASISPHVSVSALVDGQ